MSLSDDSETLREIFYSDKEKIDDGWHIIAQGDDGEYGHDLLMFLISPGGELMEQTASCCSCYGIDDQWGPYEASLSGIEAMIKQHKNGYMYNTEKYNAMKEAVAWLKSKKGKRYA